VTKITDLVKPMTMLLVFAATPLRTQY